MSAYTFLDSLITKKAKAAPSTELGVRAKRAARAVLGQPSYYLAIRAYNLACRAVDEGEPSGYPMPTIAANNNPYVSSVTITLSGVGGSDIYYTTNGTTPTTGSTHYTTPFTLTGSASYTIKAIATNGVKTSTISSLVVTQAVVATPTITPDGGSFLETTTATLACATAGATIKYTTDGSSPGPGSTTYTTPITISANTTVKAIATKTGYTNSATETSVFTQTAYLTYYGASTNTTLTESDIFAFTSKNNIANPAATYAFGANTPDKYEYIIFKDGSYRPVASTGFVTGGLPMTGDLADTGTYSNTENGWPYATVTLAGATYRVYRTKNLIALALNIVLTTEVIP